MEKNKSFLSINNEKFLSKKNSFEANSWVGPNKKIQNFFENILIFFANFLKKGVASCTFNDGHFTIRGENDHSVWVSGTVMSCT
jgi:hypothetical protein